MSEKMVLSKMYCSEQIVIPEKVSNLLKTYAKGMSVGRETKKASWKIPVVYRIQHSFTLRSSWILPLSAIYTPTEAAQQQAEKSSYSSEQNQHTAELNVTHKKEFSIIVCKEFFIIPADYVKIRTHLVGGRRKNLLKKPPLSGELVEAEQAAMLKCVCLSRRTSDRVCEQTLQELHQHMSKIKRASRDIEFQTIR